MLIEAYFDQNVPWNFLQSSWNFLNNIWTTPVVPRNSMELKQQNRKFHGIPWNLSRSKVSWNSMEFYGISNSPEKVPRNSMECHGTNLMNLILQKSIFLNIVVGIWLMTICCLAKISQNRNILHWFQYCNSYFEHPSVRANMAQGQRK